MASSDATAARAGAPRAERGFAADGYARASGRPAAAFVISGPGLTNALTALAQAYSDSVPLLLVASTPLRASLGRQLGRAARARRPARAGRRRHAGFARHARAPPKCAITCGRRSRRCVRRARALRTSTSRSTCWRADRARPEVFPCPRPPRPPRRAAIGPAQALLPHRARSGRWSSPAAVRARRERRCAPGGSSRRLPRHDGGGQGRACRRPPGQSRRQPALPADAGAGRGRRRGHRRRHRAVRDRYLHDHAAADSRAPDPHRCRPGQACGSLRRRTCAMQGDAAAIASQALARGVRRARLAQ